MKVGFVSSGFNTRSHSPFRVSSSSFNRVFCSSVNSFSKSDLLIVGVFATAEDATGLALSVEVVFPPHIDKREDCRAGDGAGFLLFSLFAIPFAPSTFEISLLVDCILRIKVARVEKRCFAIKILNRRQNAFDPY